MKPTQQMYEALKEHNPAARNLIAGLEEALRDVPDVVPFAFPGYRDRPVYLHPCGTVAEVGVEDEGTAAHIRRCDCENTEPWMRIYVERSEQR
jgi:hypothetical protein